MEYIHGVLLWISAWEHGRTEKAAWKLPTSTAF